MTLDEIIRAEAEDWIRNYIRIPLEIEAFEQPLYQAPGGVEGGEIPQIIGDSEAVPDDPFPFKSVAAYDFEEEEWYVSTYYGEVNNDAAKVAGGASDLLVNDYNLTAIPEGATALYLKCTVDDSPADHGIFTEAELHCPATAPTNSGSDGGTKTVYFKIANLSFADEIWTVVPTVSGNLIVARAGGVGAPWFMVVGDWSDYA